MPLGEFTSKYGGDVNAMLMDNINQRLQAAKVACPTPMQSPSCSLHRKLAKTHCARRGSALMSVFRSIRVLVSHVIGGC